MKRCFALLVSYDGGAFAGFQRQEPHLTVQGALEGALSRMGIRARIEGAGRTDSGVHARRQVAAFRTASHLPADLPGHLARLVPRGLSVLAGSETSPSFHPRFSSVAKVYRYRVVASPSPTAWESSTAWALPDLRGFPDLEVVPELDVGAMKRTAEAFTGRRDFTLLAHPRSEGKRERLLTRAEVHATGAACGGTLVTITLAAPGFLRHQARNLVGVVVTAGLGRLDPSSVPALLASGERWRGARAPGRGLFLWDVQYRAGEDPFRSANG